MALSYVNSALTSDATVGTTIAGTLTGVTAGNLLVAIIAGAAGTTITGVTSSPSTTWKKAAAAANSATVDIWYALAPSAGSYTVTATYSASDAGCIAIHEYSNPKGTLTQVLDVSTTSTGSGTAPTATTAATAYANDLVVAGLTYQTGNPTVTAGANFTRRQTFTDAGTTGPLTTEDRFVSATGAQTAAFASTLSVAYAEAVAVFRDADAPTLPVIIQSKTSNGTATPAAVTLTSAPTPGNLLLMLLVGRGDAQPSLTGWTQLDTVTASTSSNVRLTAMYRQAQAGDGTSYSFTLSSSQRWAAYLLELADVDFTTAAAWANQRSTHQDAAGTTFTTNSITPTVANCVIFANFATATGAVTGNAPSTPWQELADVANTTTSTSARLVTDEQQQSAAAAVSLALTWSGSAAIGCDYILAVAPTPAAAPADDYPAGRIPAFRHWVRR